MQDHEVFKAGLQKATEIIKVSSSDGSNQRLVVSFDLSLMVSRSIGFLAVLSDSAGLYKKNAFNGAKIEDPYEAIAKYKDILEKEERADLVIPLEHLYVPQDAVTCERFDFPIVLSGHDHHVVDEIIHGTRLLKPGADADHAIIIDITWENAQVDKPVITAKTVKVKDYPADEELSEKVRRAYSILDHLKKTELTPIPKQFRPLSSVGCRNRPTTIASFLWTCLREALNNSAKALGPNERTLDCVIISGGHIRGSKDYPDDAFFSLEDMKSEVQGKDETFLVQMPGNLIRDGIKASRECPNPGFLQHDDGIRWSATGELLTVAGEAFDENKLYNVGTSRWDIYEGPCKQWIDYFKDRPDRAPTASWPIYPSIVSYFARNVWGQIWNKLDANKDGKIEASELKKFDLDGDNRIDKHELAAALRGIGFEVDGEELSFVDLVMELAGDTNKDGYLTLEELNIAHQAEI